MYHVIKLFQGRIIWEMKDKVLETARRLNPCFFFKYMIPSNSDNMDMAFGELVEDSRGKITGQSSGCRDTQNGNFFHMEGNHRGTACTDVGTYTSVLRRRGGVLFGEEQGIITTKDGQGIATWTGQGIGSKLRPIFHPILFTTPYHFPMNPDAICYDKALNIAVCILISILLLN
jgi:hypothetical protein